MYFVKETLAGHVGLDKLMQTSLRGIRQKAKKNCWITELNISEELGASGNRSVYRDSEINSK